MRWLWVVPALLLGGATGVAGLVVHRHAVWVEGWPLPWGAVLAVATPLAIGTSLRAHPPAALGFLLGWLMPVLGAVGEGPGGDFLLLSDVLGWGFLCTGVLAMAVVLGISVGARGRPRNDRMRS